MAEFELVAESPAGNTPRFFYFNECGTFELVEETGTAVFAWPPAYFHNGEPRGNPKSESYHDRLIFERWDILELPNGAEDHGWIYKDENEPFWIYFSSVPRNNAGNEVYNLYYSDNGRNFNRWRTDSGTRRLPLHIIPDEQISTPPGDVSEVPGNPTVPGTPNGEMRFGLGTHLLPNEYRPCPNFRHFVGDRRTHHLKLWVDVRHPTIQTFKSDVQTCVRESAVSSLIGAIVTAYYTGGNPAAAWAAFQVTFASTFPTCVRARTGNSMDFTLGQDDQHGDWSGH